jgi:flagellar biosynthesis protein FlhF
VAPAASPVVREEHIAALEASNARLAEELGSIKGILERQLAGFAWSEISRNSPMRTQLMGELLEAGFSAMMARELTEGLTGNISALEARKSIRARLERELKIIDSDADIIDRGGVYAIVGPTGVGKTTTTAKLAARCVVRHGADKLALITTDSYRIGAHEQLRIYGRILGVSVHAVRDASDLRQTLQELRNKHTVLIDTVGMSQRDRMVLEQSSLLTSAGCVRRLLVLNSTVRGDTLDDVVAAYDGPDLAGCILSKVDEAVSLAPVLDVAIRKELQVFYVANGQRVPEDLHLPNRNYLIHRAMREKGADSAFKLNEEDACLLMAGQQGTMQASMRGAR